MSVIPNPTVCFDIMSLASCWHLCYSSSYEVNKCTCAFINGTSWTLSYSNMTDTSHSNNMSLASCWHLCYSSSYEVNKCTCAFINGTSWTLSYSNMTDTSHSNNMSLAFCWHLCYSSSYEVNKCTCAFINGTSWTLSYSNMTDTSHSNNSVNLQRMQSMAFAARRILCYLTLNCSHQGWLYVRSSKLQN